MSKSIDSCPHCGCLHCVDPWSFEPVGFSVLEDGLVPDRKMWRYAKVIAGTTYQICYKCRLLVPVRWIRPNSEGVEE